MKLVLMLLLFQVEPAWSEIDNPLLLPMGEKESLMGNSGVAAEGSAGNIFYNPAGLYALTGRKFSASGSAYAYVRGRTQVFDEGLDFDSIATVPNMVAISRHIKSWTYAFGIFSPINFEGNIETQNQVSDAGLYLTLHSQFYTEEQFVGFASGKDIGGGWSFGTSVFVHRYLNRTNSTVFAEPSPTAAYLSQSERTELEVLSLLPVIGLQKKMDNDLRLGLRISFPDVELLGRSRVKSEKLVSTTSSTVTKVNQDGNGHYRLPLDTALGAAWRFSGRHTITCDLGVQWPTRFDSMPNQPKGTYFRTETTVRQNLGYEYKMSDDYSAVLGLSRNPSSVGNSRDKDGKLMDKNTFFGLDLGVYGKEGIATSGLGLFYRSSRGKELVYNLERDKISGFQVYGLTLTTSISY
ncbi:MAG: hypothetical protein AB7F86_13575 [Bdellovibrionales bacterium]